MEGARYILLQGTSSIYAQKMTSMNCRASMNEAAVAASSGELTDRAVEGELWWTRLLL